MTDFRKTARRNIWLRDEADRALVRAAKLVSRERRVLVKPGTLASELVEQGVDRILTAERANVA